MERRFHTGDCEVREGPRGPMLVGYAAVFDSDSRNLGGFIEQVDRRAFDKTLADQPDIVALFNHDPNQLLARSSAGTLRLATDANGLRYEIDINPEDPQARAVHARVARGDIQGSSFAFVAKRQDWNWNAQPPQRRLLEVGLVDIGPVTTPAYRDSSVAIRALETVAGEFDATADELVSALTAGEMRAMWTTAYVNDLPDSSFLYVEAGGSKDSDGKTTPRSLRHFPYKDSSGSVDMPHLRNALSRIPQSSLPADVKDRVAAKAEKIMAGMPGTNAADVDAETRVGRKFSAATVAAVKKIIFDLQSLVDTDVSRQPTEEDYENEEQVDDQHPSHDGEVVKILRAAADALDTEARGGTGLTTATAEALVTARARAEEALRIRSQAA